MLLPYRAKNPPERTAYVTYGLILANVVVYALTSESFLLIRPDALEALSFNYLNVSLWRMLTAMFLHEHIFHLLGNMLFLYLVGPAVEGRLGTVKYVVLYVLTGLAGDALQMAILGQVNPRAANLGASGAIMGVAGAYLYLFPFARISVFYWWGFRWIGVTDWQARWVVLIYLGIDLFEALLYQGMDGTAHFAHLGGAALGFFIPMLLRTRRDTEDISDAQAMRTEARGDISLLAFHELEALVERNPADLNLMLQYCQKAVTRSEVNGPQRSMEIIERHGSQLLQHADPEELARMILMLPDSQVAAPAGLLIRLGGKLEANGGNLTATNCYRRVYNDNPSGPDAQTALIRWARLTEQLDIDKRNAAALYIELLQKFPNGAQSMYAESALRRLGIERPKFVYSAGDPPADTADGGAEPSTPATAAQDLAASGLSVIHTRAWETSNAAALAAPQEAAPSTVAPQEVTYQVGETRGMVLRPIGGGAGEAG